MWDEREQTVNIVNSGFDMIVDRDDEVTRLNAVALGDAVWCDFDNLDDLIGKQIEPALGGSRKSLGAGHDSELPTT